MMTRKIVHGVGEPIPRVDGAAKVTGRARYLDDLVEPGMLHGATVRSRVAHGVLRAIRRDPDFDWTGVTLVTAEEIAGGGGPNYVALLEEDQPALVPVGGTIRHVEEPVALVAADDRDRALAAAAHVELEVDQLPAVFTIEDSLAGEVRLHGDGAEPNVYKRYQIIKGKGAEIDAVLADCDLVIEGSYRTGSQEQMYIEPQGVLARWDEAGACRVIGSLQCPFFVHRALKTLFGLSDDKVVVAQSVTGGGFGGKEEYPSMIAIHAALLARSAGAPVKLVYDRREDLRVTPKRHPSLVHHRLGLSKDGTIRAVDVDLVLDGGGYVTLSPVVLSRAVLHAAGPYRCDHVRVVGRAVATNNPPSGAFRGFGAPQATFASERQVTKAARALGMDPIALRRHNLLALGDTTATGQKLESSVGSHATLDAVAARLAESPLPPVEAPTPGRSPITRGRGVVSYFHGAGFTGSGEQRLAGRATVALGLGGRFEVLVGSTDMGQGARTMFSQVAGSALGVDSARVSVPIPSTELVPDSGPTVASRTCMVVGGLVSRAATQLRQRIEAWAAEQGRSFPSLAEAAEAMAAEMGGISETTGYQPPPGIEWDDATYTGSAYPCYGWGACAVDVAIDMDTYEVKIERCIAAIDVGKAINPNIVAGQIEGGTVQGLGWALVENVIYGDGRVLNPSMTDCIIPTSADVPDLETIIIEEPFPYGPFGAKGLGEIPLDGPGAACAAAVEDALGQPFDELPILPEGIAARLYSGRQS